MMSHTSILPMTTRTGRYTCIYRSVPLIRPPILYTTSCPKRGGGVFSSTQLVSIIRPLKKFCYVYDTACSQLQKYKRSPVLFVVIMCGLPTSARRAALQLEGHINIHGDFVDFIVAILKNSNTVGHEPRVFPAEEWQ